MTTEPSPQGDTVTVYVLPHDDPAVGYQVNTIAEMRENYDDLVEQGHASFPFRKYLASWVVIDMPTHIASRADGDAVTVAWIDTYLETNA